jgi:hypothetical protein
MGSAAINGLVQLLTLGSSLIQQVNAGSITDQQAADLFSAACDNLNSAIANFNAAGAADKPAA